MFLVSQKTQNRQSNSNSTDDFFMSQAFAGTRLRKRTIAASKLKLESCFRTVPKGTHSTKTLNESDL